MPKRAQILADCGEIITAVYNNGDKVELNKAKIHAARMIVLAMMREIIDACESETFSTSDEIVRATLIDLHPENEQRYSCGEKLVRDLADLAATLHDIEQGFERRSRAKLFEVRIFCFHMRDELSRLKS